VDAARYRDRECKRGGSSAPKSHGARF